jgi:hypothetical protein
MSINGDVVDHTAYAVPVPPAQTDTSRFHSEKLADSIVVLDIETMQYHSLNELAALVLGLCDGQRSVNDITAELRVLGVEVSEQAVAMAVAQLGEAELLQGTPTIGESRLHRRQVLKLAAAGVIGAAALPVIESITVPDSAAAQTSATCCAPGSACGANGAVCVGGLLGLDINIGLCVLGPGSCLGGCPGGFVCLSLLGQCVLNTCCSIRILGIPIC